MSNVLHVDLVSWKCGEHVPAGDLRTILGLVFISARCLSRLVLELFLP
jgi:hypothetical protein